MVYVAFWLRPTLTHSAKDVDALRHSRIEYVAMMGTTKRAQSASAGSTVGISTSVSALGIVIASVLLITGCGPPS